MTEHKPTGNCRFCGLVMECADVLEVPLSNHNPMEWLICEGCVAAENQRARASAMVDGTRRADQNVTESGADYRFGKSGVRIEKAKWPDGWQQHAQVKLFLEGWGRDWSGLYIFGKTGAGKTLCAVSAIRWWCVSEVTQPLYITEPELFLLLRNFKDTKETVQKYSRCAFLVIDDLGVDSGTDFSATQMYNIIDERYRRCLPTIFVSNASTEQLGRLPTYDARIMRRMRDLCLDSYEFHPKWWMNPPIHGERPKPKQVEITSRDVTGLLGGV